MLKRVLPSIVTLTLIMVTNFAWAHPSMEPPSSKDLDALEKLASDDLSGEDLAKFKSALNTFRQETKSKANFGTTFSYPSHEIMTAQSAGDVRLIDQELKWQFINGAIWNDDPKGLISWRESMFESDIPLQWVLGFLYAEMLAGLGIPIANDNLLGRSHFGDMQFLHGMSYKAGTAPEETQKKIVDWCKFSYQVSIGGVDLHDKVIDHLNIVTIDRTLTINKLFNGHAPFFALGTIAHLIQDSYSQAHVQRDENDHILAFLVFQEQNSDGHKALDTKDAYDESGGWSKAVQHVGKVLEFASNKESWTKVETFLRNQVFRLSDGAQRSSGGGV